ncbi:MAG: hypothetical protein NC217_00345 [Muribaculaceae bacterium]|nr:hypothetical protein [Muribaculaceae bacterium]
MLGLFRRKNNILPELFWHTDIHSHVCPGIDDGSPSSQLSVQLVRGMADLGFTKMVVTPHVTDETFPNTPEIIHDSFEILTKACEQAGLKMQLRCSAEYRVDDILYNMVEQNIISPIPGGWLLVENSWFQEPFGLEAFLFDLRSGHGLKPILAHPERYPYYQRHYDRLEQLFDNGVALQVNLLSLAGHYGKQIKQTAEWLLAHDMVNFVGSDLHRPSHLEVIREYLCSKEYYKLENKADLILNDTIGAAF